MKKREEVIKTGSTPQPRYVNTQSNTFQGQSTADSHYTSNVTFMGTFKENKTKKPQQRPLPGTNGFHFLIQSFTVYIYSSFINTFHTFLSPPADLQI